MIFLALLALAAPAYAKEIPLAKIRLPDGFKIEEYAADVPGARSLALGDHGIVYVGSRPEGNVYAITPDRPTPKVHVLAHGLHSPNGVAYRGGSLYVAEISRVSRYDDVERHLDGGAKPVVLNATFPDTEHHGWKFIAFGPDGKLYVPEGAPCNICESKDPIFASITRMDPDGTHREIYASGIRNTVGFSWHPVTHELWFTDNGRDMLGDDLPPDELNRATRKGEHFGYPYCHGGDIADPEFGAKPGHECAKYVRPEQKLGPHVASLGMRFYTGGMFPAEYKNRIFIAEHGSWNRSVPIGYRVTTVTLGADGHPVKYEPFAEGWLQGTNPIGRPVDVLVMPDGALLVSDDYAGAVYRISRK